MAVYELFPESGSRSCISNDDVAVVVSGFSKFLDKYPVKYFISINLFLFVSP